jgi:hypothetical protein
MVTESASWDAGEHVREEAAFVDVEGHRIFTRAHLPGQGAVNGLVICPPLFAEFPRNYRKEVELARTLPRFGIAVQRFQYRGLGNSEGESDMMSFDSMLADTFAATDLLQRNCRVLNVAYLGTRLAAVVAAAAARARGAVLVAWEPVLDPAAYFREIVRHALMRDVAEGASGSGRPRPSIEAIEKTGFADVLGYPVHRTLYASMLQHRFVSELGEEARRILVVQLSSKDELREEYGGLLAVLRAGGHTVDARVVKTTESWWFTGDPSLSVRPTRSIVGHTSTWLRTAFG